MHFAIPKPWCGSRPGSMFSQVYSMYNKLTHFLRGALIFIAAIYYCSKPAHAHLSLSWGKVLRPTTHAVLIYNPIGSSAWVSLRTLANQARAKDMTVTCFPADQSTYFTCCIHWGDDNCLNMNCWLHLFQVSNWHCLRGYQSRTEGGDWIQSRNEM